MECFGAFYNYSQQPSPQMYFSWKHTGLFVPGSSNTGPTLEGEKRRKKVGHSYFVKQPEAQNFASSKV